ncbi:MAG TPA: Asp23/Gls24 family envelope stress response protein [Thermomicrobiales bacterium]|nr:Asp23/Gls24 family envelope stress response protein [Thermomicrobiales bacterium]
MQLANVENQGKPARGTIRISPAVLIQLIELTVVGVDGVVGLRSLRKHNWRRDFDEGAHSHDNGKVAVTVTGNQIDAAVSIALFQGANVAEVTQEIRHRIGFAAGNMLGMTVRSADVYVDDVVIPST